MVASIFVFSCIWLTNAVTPLLIQPPNGDSISYHANHTGTGVKFFFLLLPKTFNPNVIPRISSNGSTQILTPLLQAKISGLETGLLRIIISQQCFGIICENTWGWIYSIPPVTVKKSLCGSQAKTQTFHFLLHSYSTTCLAGKENNPKYDSVVLKRSRT